MQVAYPLMTLLTCLEEDSIFRRSIDTLTETLTRQLRVRSLPFTLQRRCRLLRSSCIQPGQKLAPLLTSNSLIPEPALLSQRALP